MSHKDDKLEKGLIEQENTHVPFEEDILESQRQLQATIDAITDYIFVINKNREIMRANITFARRFNKHPREIIGLKAHLLLGIDIPHPDCTLEQAIVSHMSVSSEVVIGDEIYLVSVFPAIFEDDEVFVYILKDITEMKRLRNQLYQSYKLASLGLLVSGIAHEINNPLTGILGHTELLTMKTKDEDVKKELKKIYKAAERCKRIIDSLLCFSRQEAPQKSLAVINEIIDRTLDLRMYWLRLNNVEVMKVYGNIPLAYVDNQQIQQVILKILMNAEQSIAETNRRGSIVFSTDYDNVNKKITIKISDNGKGIPQENISRIFDPFFTTKPVNQGTGLGLSIAHGIITEHGGVISVESMEGEGTTFIIDLPVK